MSEVSMTVDETDGKLGAHWPLTLLSGATSVINMAVPLVLVRILDADEVARYKMFFLYLGLVPWLSMSGGLIQGLYHFAGTRGGKGLAGVAWSASFGLALVFAAIVSPLAFWFEPSLGWGAAITIGFVMAAAFSIPSSFFEENLVAQGRVWEGAVVSSLSEFMRVAGVLLAAVLTRDVKFVVLTFAAVTAAKSLVGLFVGLNKGWIPLRPDPKDLRRVFRFAAPVSMAGVFLVLATQVDQLILSSSLSPERFTLYTLGCLTLPFLISFEQAVNKVLIPNLTTRIENGRVEAATLFRNSIEELASVLVPAVAGLVTFASPIITILFSEKYQSASVFLSVYAFSYLFPAIPFDAAARARGETGWILRSYLISGSIGLIVGLLLVPHFAEWGAMASVFLAQAVLRLQGLHYLRSRLKWKLRDALPLATLWKFIAVSILLSLGSLILRPLFSDDRLWFLVAGSAFSLIYFKVILHGRLPRFIRRAA